MVRNTNVHIRLEGNCSTQNGEFIEIILVRSVSLNQVGCVQSEDTIFGLDHEECQSKTNVQQKGVDHVPSLATKMGQNQWPGITPCSISSDNRA